MDVGLIEKIATVIASIFMGWVMMRERMLKNEIRVGSLEKQQKSNEESTKIQLDKIEENYKKELEKVEEKMNKEFLKVEEKHEDHKEKIYIILKQIQEQQQAMLLILERNNVR